MTHTDVITRALACVHPDPSTWCTQEDEHARVTSDGVRAWLVLDHQGWWPHIRSVRLGGGIGAVATVWLAELEPTPGIDAWLWVVVGDLPSAYLVLDVSPDPISAFKTYAGMMRGWCTAVRAGRPLRDEFPIEAPADAASADAIERRLDVLRTQVVPALAACTAFPLRLDLRAAGAR